MLGKLARYLRILGYDTIYNQDLDDNDLLDISKKEGRIILTRDRKLKENAERENVRCILIEKSSPIWLALKQLKNEVSIELNFDIEVTRCPLCNGELKKTDRPQLAYHKFSNKYSYYICTKCGSIYWEGKHLINIKRVLNEANDESN